VPALLAFVLAHPVAAADVSCAQWVAYRAGDASLQGQGPVFAAFLQGYIDAVNEYSDLLRRVVLFRPEPPSRDNFVPPQLRFEDTAASLDRLCSVFDPTDSAVEIGVNDIKTEMVRRARPIISSMIERLRVAPGRAGVDYSPPAGRSR
jgi:hypothetical protein